MALTPAVRGKLKARGDVVIENPKQSVISLAIPHDIRIHHLTRALQVLQINQTSGRFTKTDFDVFVGPGAVNAIGDSAARKRPPNTTRRGLATLSVDTVGKWLPFPGRIYFTQGEGADLVEAVTEFLKLFYQNAPRGQNSRKKNHPYRYAQTLAVFIDGTRTDPAQTIVRLESTTQGTAVEFVNYSPHASRLELDESRRKGRTLMFGIARILNQKYSPGVQVGFDYVASSDIGLTYGEGTGGPTARSAKKQGRAYPAVYALPRVTFLLPGVGKSNLKFRAPGLKLSRAARSRLRG